MSLYTDTQTALTMFIDSQHAYEKADKRVKEWEEKRENTVSEARQKLFMCAKQCKLDVKKFLSVCKDAEKAYKEQHEGATIPRTWTYTKSNIKCAMEAGIDPTKYDTLNAYKQAKLDLSKQTNQAGRKGGKGGKGEAPNTNDGNKDNTKQDTELHGLVPELAKAVKEFHKIITAAPVDTQTQIAVMLEGFNEEVREATTGEFAELITQAG